MFIIVQVKYIVLIILEKAWGVCKPELHNIHESVHHVIMSVTEEHAYVAVAFDHLSDQEKEWYYEHYLGCL